MSDVIEPNVLTIERVLNDPSASYWLKDALKQAFDRDPVDAASDAAILAVLLQNRAEGILQANNTNLNIK